MIEIRNLLFQPLTFHLAGGGRGIHLNPRERRMVREEDVSPEIEAAARRGLVSLTAAPEASVEVTPNIGRRGQTGIAVTGSNFTPNATDITIRCDGRVVASGVSADAAGRVTASFVIPSNVRNGNRIVEVTDGTYSAQTNLQVNDPLVITRIQRIVVNRTIVRRQTIIQRIPPRIIRVPVVRTVWRWRWRTRRRDPLAQTFSFTENRVISAIGIYFTRKDASIPVTVQIRGVTTGLPNEVVLAEKVVSPDEVNLGTETKVVFDDPFYAEANTSYAVVLLTNSTEYRVRIATLGQMGQNGVITRQTYAAGVLLESSNAETWTPLNGSDLTMKIYGYDFQPTGEVRFLPVTGVQFSDLNLDEYSSIPEGTGIVWEYSTDGGATWEPMSIESTREIDQEWTEYTLTRTFSDPTGNKVRYKAEMTGNNLVYPRIHTLGATLS